MGIDFTANDIFEMAKQIERNGAKFYRKAAENIADVKTRELLLDLAAIEDQHLKTFTDFQQTLKPEERESMVFDPDATEDLYLKALADTSVFDTKRKPDEELSGKETTRQIIQTALGMEKDSIVFYAGMKKYVPAEKGAGKIDLIIEEELRHIAILSQWKRM